MSLDNWGREERFQPEVVNKAYDRLGGINDDFGVVFPRKDSRYGRGYSMTNSERGGRFEAANKIVAIMNGLVEVAGNFEQLMDAESQLALGVVFVAELRSFVVKNIEPKDKKPEGGLVKASRGEDDEMPESWGNSIVRLAFEWGVLRVLLKDDQFKSKFSSYAGENGIDLSQMGRDIKYLLATEDGDRVDKLA